MEMDDALLVVMAMILTSVLVALGAALLMGA